MAPELVYSFGHYRLLPDRRALFAAEQPVKLGGRGFDLLATLVENSDRVISKDELMERVWPRLVVEENNLSVQILMLRKLLGHPAISTVPGRGYRFAMPVVQTGGPPRLAAHLAAPLAVQAFPAAPASGPVTGPATSPPGNLPAQVPTLYGRGEDLAIVTALLAEHRLVTVAGAGGIGKTRLGQAVAAHRSSQHADGVWWVELAPVSQGALVAAAVADALGIDLSDGRDATRSIVAHLHDRHLLLVLDNCEHVLDAVAALAAAIGAAAPHLRLLVTSQEVLKAVGEHVYRLGTLSLPDAAAPLSVATAAQSGAVALFVARARAVESRFALGIGNVEAVVDICRRLDGIPLAIELAAARLPLLGIDGLRAKLNQRFNVLTGGSRAVLRRHQTLHAALQWSHDLLDVAEQAVFRRLGVFSGGFTLEAAQHVADDDQIDEWDVLEHLGALVDKSLVVAEGDPLPRYRFLETTRLFALERLAASGETDTTLRRHVQAMVLLIEDHQRRVGARQRNEAVWTPANQQLMVEIDNVRAAFDWLEQARDGAPELETLSVEFGGVGGLVIALAGREHEAFERTLALRGCVSAATPPPLAARYWQRLGALGAIAGHEASLEASSLGATLYQDLGDDRGRFGCLVTLIATGARRGAGPALEQAVADAARIVPDDPRSRWAFGWARYRWLMSIGRAREALDALLEEAAAARDAGDLLREQFLLGDTVADCEMALGLHQAAEQHCRDALAALEGEPGMSRLVAHVIDTFARALVLQGKSEEALATARAALQLTRNEGFHFRLLEPLALNAARQGRLSDAAWLTGHVDAIFAKRGEVRWPDVAARRSTLDAMLAEGLDPSALASLRAEGAAATVDAAFARALGDG